MSEVVAGEALSSLDVFTLALDVVQTALDEPGRTDAMIDVRAQLADLDDVALRRLVACLAVELVGLLRDDQTSWERLRTWISVMRCEVSWEATP